MIYSRRIAAPVAAAKLTGKVSGTTVASMFAVDGRETSRTGTDHPFFAIARAQRDLGGGSRAGLVFTSRTEPGQSNQLGGIDTRVVLPGNVVISAQAVGSITTRDGHREIASLWGLDVRRAGKHFGFQAGFDGVSDAFEAGAGFIGVPDAVTLSGGPSWTGYGKPGAVIARATGGVRVNGRSTYDEFVAGRNLQDRQLFLTGSFEFRGGWTLNVFNWFEYFGYDRRLFKGYALEYQVNRSLFVRVVGEYRASKRDALRDDGRTGDPILFLDPKTAGTHGRWRRNRRATGSGPTSCFPFSPPRARSSSRATAAVTATPAGLDLET